MRPGQRFTAGLVALCVAMVTSGCALGGIEISTSSGDRAEAKAATGFVRDNKITVDLRSKPTREDLGFVPGESAAIFERSPGAADFVTTVLLPNGGRFTVPAWMVATFPPVTGGTEPDSTIVYVRYSSVDEAIAQLRSQRSMLGMGLKEFDRLVRQIQNNGQTYVEEPSMTLRPWLRAQVYLHTVEQGENKVRSCAQACPLIYYSFYYNEGNYSEGTAPKLPSTAVG